MCAFIKDSSVVVLPVFKTLNLYVTKSTIGDAEPFKGPSPHMVTCSENF